MNHAACYLVLCALAGTFLCAACGCGPARQPSGHGTPAVPGGDAVASPAVRGPAVTIEGGGPSDLDNPRVIPSGVLDLGVHDLAAGKHKLTLEITGANEKALKAYMAGVDYVKLDPANRRS